MRTTGRTTQRMACSLTFLGAILFHWKQQHEMPTSVLPSSLKTKSSSSSYNLLPLSDLVDEHSGIVKANVQFLLDFAVIGHPKCATTFLLEVLVGHHTKIVMPEAELHAEKSEYPQLELVKELYKLPAGDYKRGYKNPGDIERTAALERFRDFFPKTKLIVGIRHPVLWFQSYYNYRISDGKQLPPANELIGNHCVLGICSKRANFHIHLAQLGKTRLNEKEQQLLQRPDPNWKPTGLSVPNPVFLYEQTQLDPRNNRKQSEQTLLDLSNFLRLDTPITNPHTDAVTNARNASIPASLDICLPEYNELRAELMKSAIAASEWIVHYFLPHATVSDPNFWRNRFQNEWHKDPCNNSGGHNE